MSFAKALNDIRYPNGHFVLMFDSHFASMVEAGTKRQTVRPIPKRRKIPTIGCELDLRRWEGKAYRSKQAKILETPLLAVAEIFVKENMLVIHGNSSNGGPFCAPKPEESLTEKFAKADGFQCWDDFVSYIGAAYGLPFSGVAYQW